jgi:hypothetical protein
VLIAEEKSEKKTEKKPVSSTARRFRTPTSDSVEPSAKRSNSNVKNGLTVASPLAVGAMSSRAKPQVCPSRFSEAGYRNEIDSYGKATRCTEPHSPATLPIRGSVFSKKKLTNRIWHFFLPNAKTRNEDP